MHLSPDCKEIFVLIREWRIISPKGIAGSFIAVLALAVLYECLKGIHTFLKLHLKTDDSPRRMLRRKSEDIDGVSKRRNLFTEFTSTCLYIVKFSVSYFLMLVTYTYNTWLFVAVVIGHGLGFYLVTPLIDTYTSREGTGDYSDLRRDSLLTRRKRQPLIRNADI